MNMRRGRDAAPFPLCAVFRMTLADISGEGYIGNVNLTVRHQKTTTVREWKMRKASAQKEKNIKKENRAVRSCLALCCSIGYFDPANVVSLPF